jgi:hypothetical protein
MTNTNTERVESLGPAETIISALIKATDHMVHNRPGIVVSDNSNVVGTKWYPVTHKSEEGQDVVYRLDKVGAKSVRTRIGIRGEDGIVRSNGRVVGEYRKPGIYKEVASFLYRQVANVWDMDNEFVARWASWSMNQEYRDLKVVLAAFSMVQNRMGAPIREGGEILFYDDDYRDVGEAMCLVRSKGKDIDAKLLIRIGDVLRQDDIAAMNRELGFGISTRRPAMGRYNKVVEKWLRYRENNPRMLAGLIKSGQRKMIMTLAKRVGYKPQTEDFFKVLRWKQKQSEDGRRTMMIGVEVSEAESWVNLTERQICEKIMSDKPNFKRITGLLGTTTVGLTRAIMAAAIDGGCLSDADLIILTPTLEELGLLKVAAIKQRWETATLNATNQRAMNIARNVKSRETADVLKAGADAAVQKAVEEKVANLRLYVIVDKSASMDGAIEKAKQYLSMFIHGFPLDKIHVSIFNTVGRELRIRNRSSAGVTQAFMGHSASGGTNYAAGVSALANRKPAADEDAIMLFVGDQDPHASGGVRSNFASVVRASGINPVSFALIEVGRRQGRCVDTTATALGIPCVRIQEDTFQDPYAVQRVFTHLIESAPIGASSARAPRKTLIDTILETELLAKPAWA